MDFLYLAVIDSGKILLHRDREGFEFLYTRREGIESDIGAIESFSRRLHFNLKFIFHYKSIRTRKIKIYTAELIGRKPRNTVWVDTIGLNYWKGRLERKGVCEFPSVVEDRSKRVLDLILSDEDLF